MGLDMYLKARIFCPRPHSEQDTDRTAFDAIFKAIKLTPPERCLLAYVEYPIGYWRKANAIHGWFVRNLAGDVDNCDPIDVSPDDLASLRDACLAILHLRTTDPDAARILAEDTLPPAPGFFFGTYDYDAYYYESLQYTSDLLTTIIAQVNDEASPLYGASFQYEASW